MLLLVLFYRKWIPEPTGSPAWGPLSPPSPTHTHPGSRQDTPSAPAGPSVSPAPSGARGVAAHLPARSLGPAGTLPPPPPPSAPARCPVPGDRSASAAAPTPSSRLCGDKAAHTHTGATRGYAGAHPPSHAHTRGLTHTPGDVDPDTHTAPALRRTNRGPGLPARAPAHRLGAVQPPGACPPACQCSRTGNRAWSPRRSPSPHTPAQTRRGPRGPEEAAGAANLAAAARLPGAVCPRSLPPSRVAAPSPPAPLTRSPPSAPPRPAPREEAAASERATGGALPEPPEPGPRVGRSRAGPWGEEERRGLSPASPPGAGDPPPASQRGPAPTCAAAELGGWGERRGDEEETPPRAPSPFPSQPGGLGPRPPPPPGPRQRQPRFSLAQTRRLSARCPGLTPRPGAQLAGLLHLQP
ncbi:uncharacterized protein [Eschrichtius robustus]|uniref:uncharacterized protein n=1 Tax=Eschrichtius robustus TaxID=9764 RepID=UPI0035C24F59